MPYRWNTSDFAIGYDAAAAVVHPHYHAIQEEIVKRLALPQDAPALVVDLGGGSGRLIERILDRWPLATGLVLDQSEPFLALAERRLSRFGERAGCFLARLQDDWSNLLPGPVDALVSMSAIHHLEPAEKKSLYDRCFAALAPAGVLLNGDEVRAESDADYRGQLTAWAEGMQQAMAGGAVPPSFHEALHGWIRRNVVDFGLPKKSGDDCHETIEAQLDYLRAAGFATPHCVWSRDLWALLSAAK